MLETVTLNDALKDERAYWLARLSGGIESAAPPTDRKRHKAGSHKRDALRFRVPGPLSRQLSILKDQSRLDLYSFLMAALKVCMYRYTGNETIVVGSPARRDSGQSVKQANLLVIRDTLDEQLSFAEFLRNVRQSLSEAYERQDYPYSHLMHDLGIKQAAKRFPLFDTLLVLEGFHGPIPEISNDVTIYFTESAGELSGRVEYKASLFKKESIERFTVHLKNSMERAMQNMHAPVWTLDTLSSQERRRLLLEWNNTEPEAGPACPFVHELFEKQAALAPERPAVIFEEQRLSYRELNERANQMARYLSGLGVGPEVFVALCLDRSLDLLVIILGILKAGGAYVPLDPLSPGKRLSHILAELKPAVLVAEDRLAAEGELDGVPVIGRRQLQTELSHYEKENLSTKAEAENLAYAIYTSGSTGNPKGVLVTHGNLAHSTSARLSFYDGRINGFLLTSPVFFDSSVAGIFWTLAQGGTLVLPSENFQHNPKSLSRLIARRGVSHLLCIPSLYELLLDQCEADKLAALECVIVAGEPCPQRVVKRHREKLSQAALFNEYGPTEGTVWSTVYRCDKGRGAVVPPPIGRPVERVCLYVLDQALRLVPVGVRGELYIGGAGISRGYLRSPDLTAERFLPDPFTACTGSRLYRTGDFVRYLADGNLEFVGRVDNQVKIRGVRIEPEEVEAQINLHPSVQQCVVQVREDGPAGKQLAAYIVPRSNDVPFSHELKQFLKERLPEEMLPSFIIFLQSLPQSPNGKVDRHALPAPTASAALVSEALTASCTQTERSIRQIWTEMFGHEQIGIHDNFFDLGGHSLLATRLMQRLQHLFQIELPLYSLFESPTIAELARDIDRLTNTGKHLTTTS